MCAVQANLLMAWTEVLSRVLTAVGASAHSLSASPLADRLARLGKIWYLEIPAQAALLLE